MRVGRGRGKGEGRNCSPERARFIKIILLWLLLQQPRNPNKKLNVSSRDESPPRGIAHATAVFNLGLLVFAEIFPRFRRRAAASLPLNENALRGAKGTRLLLLSAAIVALPRRKCFSILVHLVCRERKRGPTLSPRISLFSLSAVAVGERINSIPPFP